MNSMILDAQVPAQLELEQASPFDLTKDTLRPEYIDQHHWEEWLGSGVSPEIIRRNVRSIHDSREVDRVLNRNTKHRTKHSDHLVPCWEVTGLDPLGWEKSLEGVQVKPDIAPIGHDGKPQKYLGASEYGAAPLFLETEENDYWLRILKDTSIPIIITEGGKKAGAGLSVDRATISIPGVSTCRKLGYLHEKLAIFIKPGRTVYLAFDNDAMTKKPVQDALWKLGCLLAALGAKVMVIVLPPGECKGMDDFIAAHGLEEFDSVVDEALTIEEWRSRLQENHDREKIATDADKSKRDRIPKADILATQIADEFSDKFIWNNERKTWMIYEHKHPGIWSTVDNHLMETHIQTLLSARGIVGYGSDSYIINICKFLSRILVTFEWAERQGVLPFEDGVALVGSGKFEEHSPGNRLTWCLPRRYFTPAVSDWGTIRAWMSQMWSDSTDREILIHFAAAVLNRRHDLQKFLYLVGTGGSGKGTYTRLLQAVIGSSNVWAGKIESLANPNETFRLVGKPLAVFADQDKVVSGMQLFKNLTGGDTLSAKQLYKDGFNFNFEGLALISANAPALLGSGSWIKRRAIVVSCNHQPEVEKTLSEEFAPEIAAFTKYLLSISNEDIDHVLRAQRPTSGAVEPAMWEVLQRQDSIAAWVEEHVSFDSASFSLIGSNKDEDEANPDLATLFGSYHRYCRRAGLQGKSLVNFAPELEELCQKTLGFKYVARHRKKSGRGMIGIRLRGVGSPHLSETLFSQKGDGLVMLGDGFGDELGDGFKPLLHKESDEGDGLNFEKLKGKNQISDSLDNALPCENPQTIQITRHLVIAEAQNNGTATILENSQPVTSETTPAEEPQKLVGCDIPLAVAIALCSGEEIASPNVPPVGSWVRINGRVAQVIKHHPQLSDRVILDGQPASTFVYGVYSVSDCVVLTKLEILELGLTAK